MFPRRFRSRHQGHHRDAGASTDAAGRIGQPRAKDEPRDVRSVPGNTQRMKRPPPRRPTINSILATELLLLSHRCLHRWTSYSFSGDTSSLWTQQNVLAPTPSSRSLRRAGYRRYRHVTLETASKPARRSGPLRPYSPRSDARKDPESRHAGPSSVVRYVVPTTQAQLRVADRPRAPTGRRSSTPSTR